MNSLTKQERRKRRHRRIRGKLTGTAQRPRLFVFRSHKHIYAQLFDDEKNSTLAQACDKEIEDRKTKKRMEISRELGKLIAIKAGQLKITGIIFDRGGYQYHGNVEAFAQGAREGGLLF